MEKPPRKIDRKKIYAGVFLLCLSGLLMLALDQSPEFLARAAWIPVFAAGLLLFLWGRFYSGGES